MDKITFEPYDEKYLDLSWKWLNDPEIKQLTLTPDFDIESQIRWFKTLGSKKDYYLYGVLAGNNPIGVCGLKNIKDSEGEYWGYIGEKEYWGKGIGKIMLDYIIQFAYQLDLKSLYLKVWDNNLRAISLYEKNGFNLISKTDDVCIMQKSIT
jgi:RimJ/RimL family protein N-acetyltransferase